MPRMCECGCGIALKGSIRRRFVNDSHRMRANRAVARGERVSAPPVEPSANGHGRARAALDAWLPRAVGAPEPLLEAAKMLADVVDDDPTNSPLWGRYWRALDALAVAALDSAPDWRETQLELKSTQAVEEYRARRYRAANTDGERGRWERMVPVGCLRGEHRWRRETVGYIDCLDCHVVRPDDWVDPPPYRGAIERGQGPLVDPVWSLHRDRFDARHDVEDEE